MENVTALSSARPQVLEFFAGIGLARMGLENAGFHVSWANDFEPAKMAMYSSHFGIGASGEHQFALGDIAEVVGADLPSDAAVAWASSPCTDLSLAGARAGLAGTQSGTFWHFIRLLRELDETRPAVVVLENVIGLATSHGGDDLAAAIRAFNELGYSVDVLALDARRFIPQSRPRLFLVGALHPPADDELANVEIRPEWLQSVYSDPTLITHRAKLPEPPPLRMAGFGEVVEAMPEQDDRWWPTDRVERFTSSLSPIQRARISAMQASPAYMYRTAYRRTRNGIPVWEVRPDDISGCLRTARGGSSKQAVVKLGRGELQVRWMTPLEYARLMGAGDYELSAARTNQALYGFGDAVAVPVVSWLSENYLMPLVKGKMREQSGPGRASEPLRV